MLFLGCIIVVLIDGAPITFTCEVDLFPESDIFQITRPAAGCFHLQNKSIIFCIIRAHASHTEIGDEFAVVQPERVSGASTIDSKIENTSVRTANRGGCVAIPVKEFG